MAYPEILTKRYLAKFDEINSLMSSILKDRNARTHFEDFLLDMYIEGFAAGNYIVGGNAKVEDDRARDVINWFYPEADKSILEKFSDYFTAGDISSMWRLWESEAHRVYVTGELDSAGEKARKKVWCTMLDDRVRDSHAELEGVTVNMWEDFWIGDDHAEGPGLFDLAENNANCRCVLDFKK